MVSTKKISTDYTEKKMISNLNVPLKKKKKKGQLIQRKKAMQEMKDKTAIRQKASSKKLQSFSITNYI